MIERRLVRVALPHIVVGFVLCAVGQVLAPAAHAGEPLIIAVSRTPLSAPFFIAEAAGLFQAQGLDVRIDDYTGGHVAMNALLEGRSQLATSSDLVVVFNGFTSRDFALIATFVTAAEDSKLVVRRSAGIVGPGDLVGRRVGYTPASSSHYFLEALLTLNNIAVSDVVPVPLEPAAMADALRDLEPDVLAGGWSRLRFGLSLEQSLLLTLEDEAEWAIRSGNRHGALPNFLDFIDVGPLFEMRPAAVTIFR